MARTQKKGPDFTVACAGVPGGGRRSVLLSCQVSAIALHVVKSHFFQEFKQAAAVLSLVFPACDLYLVPSCCND